MEIRKVPTWPIQSSHLAENFMAKSMKVPRG
jgi:hypothetical protein